MSQNSSPYTCMRSVCPVSSLRSKRFRGVWKQRKTEGRDFRCFVCAENGARAKTKKEGVGEGKEDNVAY